VEPPFRQPVVIGQTALAWVAALFLSSSLFAHTVALRLALLMVGAALAAVTAWRNRGDVRWLPAIWLPCLLWAAWAWLSVAWSVEPERTLKELRNETVYTGLALWVCFVGAQAANAARIVVPVVGAAAAAVMAIGLREFSIGLERYAHGLHGGPGDHSSALLTLAPCVAMTAWYGWRDGWRPGIQLPVWILGPLILASAYCTLNRTVWIGLAVEILLIGLLIQLRQRGSTRRPWSVRARLAGGLLVVAVIGGAAATLGEIQAKRESAGGTSLARDHRLLLWPEISELIAARPLTGYGFGRGLLRHPLRAEFGTVDGHLWHAHNTFLEQLIQLGMPGLALFLLLLAAILREGWRMTLDASDFRAACGIALTAVVAGMLVRNMTDTLFVRGNSLLFWGVTGTLLGLATLRRSRPAQGLAA
jgi:O-antigen ligase